MYRPRLTLTVENARETFEAGRQAIAGGQAEVDLGELTTIDSTAIATLLAWQRTARNNGTTLVFRNFPANLQSLVGLYGVAELLNPPHPASSSAPANI